MLLSLLMRELLTSRQQHQRKVMVMIRYVTVSIKDCGTGIDAGIFPRLFTKFATKSNKGTGLGLFICKNIVEAHDGRIWAKNNPDGKGATFSFTLPLPGVSSLVDEVQNT